MFWGLKGTDSHETKEVEGETTANVRSLWNWGWISLELRRSKCLYIPLGTPQFAPLSTPGRALKEFVSFPAITVSFIALISTGGGANEHGQPR